MKYLAYFDISVDKTAQSGLKTFVCQGGRTLSKVLVEIFFTMLSLGMPMP